MAINLDILTQSQKVSFLHYDWIADENQNPVMYYHRFVERTYLEASEISASKWGIIVFDNTHNAIATATISLENNFWQTVLSSRKKEIMERVFLKLVKLKDVAPPTQESGDRWEIAKKVWKALNRRK